MSDNTPTKKDLETIKEIAKECYEHATVLTKAMDTGGFTKYVDYGIRGKITNSCIEHGGVPNHIKNTVDKDKGNAR